MRAPQNKDESIDLYRRSRYGNSLRVFDDVVSAYNSDVKLYAIRYRGDPGVQGPAIFDIPKNLLAPAWAAHCMHWNEKRSYICECMDPMRVLVQGELELNWQDGWYFQGRLGGGMHMREAMKNSKIWRGWPARELLRSLMDPSSWDDLNLCIDEWPDAVIELVVLDTPTGAMAHTGRRAVIWEARGF